ncbi:unnamed protein product [Lactuca saligna]|uniref:RING-type E3 ubiquitin transferase n=1 Tax=Lactuca saligna TaxID=75948 RepID=A0AA36EFU2_LACSI|nr:unnamed protein product [Lactuca saligna]
MQGQRSIFDPFPEAVDLNQGSNSSNNASMDESDDWNNMLSPMERRLLNNDLSSELNFSYVNNTNLHHNFRSFSNWDVGESSSRATLQDHVSNNETRSQEHQHHRGHVDSSSSSSSSSLASNHIPMNVNLSIGYGGSNTDDDGMGFMDVYKSGKRKALEGTTSGQPGQSGQPSSLNISSTQVNPLVMNMNRNESPNTRISSVEESPQTHFGMRGSVPYNLSSGNAPRCPNRQILINEFLDQTSRNNLSNQQPPLMLPRNNTSHFPFGINIGSRNGSLGNYPLERGTELNFRSLIRNNNVQYHNFVPSSENRNIVQDPTNWSLATGSGSGAPSSSRNTTVWTQHNNPTMQSQQRLSDFSPWTLFPSGESQSGGQRGHFATFPAGSSSSSSSSTSEDAHAHISSGAPSQRHHHGQPFSRSPMEVSGDDWRALAADIEGRQRLVSEIRQVLHAMRRGENLRAEDYMLFDPFINGVAELHDRHRDMRLDVDNMSYEELLALEERIGNVNTGLREEVILKSMKQRKHIAFMPISNQNLEPCCICQEEYDTGDNIGNLDCGHDFHTDCIKQWLSQKNICPICKMTGLAP